MKCLFPALALILITPASLRSFAADTSKEKPAESATASVAGEYTGEWRRSPEESGDLHLKLKHDGTTWSAEASFTYQTSRIPTKMRAIEVDGLSVQLIFDWVIDDTTGQSTIKGELKGDALEGTYETTGRAGESKGTWKVVRVVKGR